MPHASRALGLVAVVALTLPLLASCQSGGRSSGSGAVAASATLPSLPIPAGVQVVAPPPSVPAEFAAFSGTWGGYWDGVMPSLLIVEHVDASGDADGTYVWGSVPQWNVEAGHFKFRSKIVDRKLSWGSGARFTFAYAADGKLHGERIASGMQNDVLMVKEAR